MQTRHGLLHVGTKFLRNILDELQDKGLGTEMGQALRSEIG
jgi:hypothetical protein